MQHIELLLTPSPSNSRWRIESLLNEESQGWVYSREALNNHQMGEITFNQFILPKSLENNFQMFFEDGKIGDIRYRGEHDLLLQISVEICNEQMSYLFILNKERQFYLPDCIITAYELLPESFLNRIDANLATHLLSPNELIRQSAEYLCI